MKSIESAYINALLADAAYIQVAGGINTADMKERMTATQAAFIVDNFTVVTSLETPNTIHSELGTGFDAVVWQIKAGSELGNRGQTPIKQDPQLAHLHRRQL